MSEQLFRIKPPEWNQSIDTDEIVFIAHWFGHELWCSFHSSSEKGQRWHWSVESRGLWGYCGTFEQAKQAAEDACRTLFAEHLEQVK